VVSPLAPGPLIGRLLNVVIQRGASHPHQSTQAPEQTHLNSNSVICCQRVSNILSSSSTPDGTPTTTGPQVHRFDRHYNKIVDLR
jgi:hypothetical protein